MKLLPWLIFFAFLSGCSTKFVPAHIAPAPSSAAVKSDVSKASASVKEARTGISQAKADVTAARDEVRVIIGELPEDLKPKVGALEMRLSMALRELEDADQRAVTAEMELTKADGHIAELQQDIEREHTAYQAEADAHAKAEAALGETKAKLSHQTALAWKWRLISFGIVALVIGFFVARQYLPFLKLI